jgi:hypothetical protein
VSLRVTPKNATGASELYARNGMSFHYAVDTWEIVVSLIPVAAGDRYWFVPRSNSQTKFS